MKYVHSIFDIVDYPWRDLNVTGWAQLKRWLFLPDYMNPPSAKPLIGRNRIYTTSETARKINDLFLFS